MASMVSSFVIWMQIEEGVTLLFPDRTYAFPGILADAVVEFGPFFLRASSLAMLAIAALCRAGACSSSSTGRISGLPFARFRRTRPRARVAGVNTGLVTLLAFACASALGGARRLPDRRGRPADHAALRALGDLQGTHRHDAGRHGLDTGRGSRRAAPRRRRGRTRSGISASRRATSSPTCCSSSCSHSGPAASWARRPSWPGARPKAGSRAEAVLMELTIGPSPKSPPRSPLFATPGPRALPHAHIPSRFARGMPVDPSAAHAARAVAGRTRRSSAPAVYRGPVPSLSKGTPAKCHGMS